MPAAPPEGAADFSALLAERHVALAVSGGSDSIALMRLAQDWARSTHPGLRLSVLTVDHRLRPGSAEEAAQTGRWAAELGLSHHTLSWEAEPKPSTGIQAKARAARYGLMAQWCRANDAAALLTAHTIDDQAETVLMRLARTTSPESLAGIRPRGAWGGLPVLRPLLGMRRQALRDHLATLGQEWLDDPSNSDPRFERVRVRQALTVAGGTDVTIGRLAALAEASARTSDLLERMSRRWIALFLDEREEGCCLVPFGAFNGLPAALRQRILTRIVIHYGGGGLAPEPREIRRLLDWAEQGTGPVRCTLGGAVLGRRKLGFWVTREASRIVSSPMTIPESGTALWDGRFRVEASPGAVVTPSAQRPPQLRKGIPAHAGRAYPLVETPSESAKMVQISFLRLANDQEHN